MKITQFGEDKVTGIKRAIGVLEDVEDELIKSIDEGRMSPAKRAATRFLQFLKDKRMTIQELSALPKDKQKSIKQEFLDMF